MWWAVRCPVSKCRGFELSAPVGWASGSGSLPRSERCTLKVLRSVFKRVDGLAGSWSGWVLEAALGWRLPPNLPGLG